MGKGKQVRKWVRAAAWLIVAALVPWVSGCKVGEIFYESRVVDTGEVVEVEFVDEAGTVVEAGTPILEEVVELKPWVRTAVESTGALPVPGADLIGLLLSGALGIGAIWQNRKKRTAEKVAESTIKGIDVFRDVLDQTDGGKEIDNRLTKILRDEQAKLEVFDEVNRLLQRYATPAKGPIGK